MQHFCGVLVHLRQNVRQSFIRQLPERNEYLIYEYWPCVETRATQEVMPTVTAARQHKANCVLNNTYPRGDGGSRAPRDDFTKWVLYLPTVMVSELKYKTTFNFCSCLRLRYQDIFFHCIILMCGEWIQLKMEALY